MNICQNTMIVSIPPGAPGAKEKEQYDRAQAFKKSEVRAEDTVHVLKLKLVQRCR